MKRIKTSLLIFLALIIAFPDAVLAVKKQESYLIGREDVLDITVWQSPDLTKAVTVQSDGTIDYPLLGNLLAEGLTPGALASHIREQLSKGYVKEPKVNVLVKEYNSKKIMVFGEVTKPGLYKLKGEMPLLEILFMVGGVRENAKSLTIIRPTLVTSTAEFNGRPVSIPVEPRSETASQEGNAIKVDLIALLSKGDLTQNIRIKPGDTLYFASGTGLRYHVLGQVRNPGPYEWLEDITVLEAIKLAGGATEKAAPNRIKVRKIYDGQKQVIKINVVEIMKGKKKDDVIIKPGDTIIVPESWI